MTNAAAAAGLSPHGIHMDGQAQMTRSAGSRAPATRRSVWILFSSRPLSAALAKTWFRVLFAAAAALALTDGVADLRAAPPAPAGRYFRLTPADPRHAFVASPPPVPARRRWLCLLSWRRSSRQQ